MPNDYFPVTWDLWDKGVIDVTQVIKALDLYGYELNYITKQGIKGSKFGETIEFRLRD